MPAAASAMLLHDLAAGNPDLVVGGGDVDQVRSVDVDRQVGLAQLVGELVLDGFFQLCGSPRKNWIASAPAAAAASNGSAESTCAPIRAVWRAMRASLVTPVVDGHLLPLARRPRRCSVTEDCRPTLPAVGRQPVGQIRALGTIRVGLMSA